VAAPLDDGTTLTFGAAVVSAMDDDDDDVMIVDEEDEAVKVLGELQLAPASVSRSRAKPASKQTAKAGRKGATRKASAAPSSGETEAKVVKTLESPRGLRLRLRHERLQNT
jgi:hypothetical protein